MSSGQSASSGTAPKHMDPATQALCYFYRHPPPNSGVRPQRFKAIPALIQQPRMQVNRVKQAVARFMQKKAARGRKTGWRKTTPAEDAAIFAAFQRVRQPLGILVEARDVWKALRPSLRSKVCVRTVANRLRAKGFRMEEKRAGDDEGEKWRRRRLAFCASHKTKTSSQWCRRVQAVVDFRYFVYYPRGMKARFARNSAPLPARS